MQRPVKLYTVEEQLVMAYDRVSFHRMHGIDPNATIIDKDGVTLATVERIDVPVQRFMEPTQSFGDQQWDKREWKESFIAIDPKLEWMIRQPIVEQMEATETRARAAMSQMMLYQDRISDYNDLPWYKRIFRRV